MKAFAVLVLAVLAGCAGKQIEYRQSFEATHQGVSCDFDISGRKAKTKSISNRHLDTCERMVSDVVK